MELLVTFFSLPLDLEADTRRCFVKKVFLEISQNSQENTCARVSFVIKLQTPLTERLWWLLLWILEENTEPGWKNYLVWAAGWGNKQTIIFYIPSNALCSSDKSIQIKHFNHHTSIGKYFFSTWLNLQLLNFCSRRRVLNRLSKCAQMCATIKNRRFYSLPLVHNQNYFPVGVVLVFLLLTLNIFHTLF